jgi:anti-sigma B factor antagonist
MKMSSAMDNLATVMLPEQIDSETSASVEASIVAAVRPGGGVIVDGSAVTYMSAAGVRVFARALHRAEEQGARIVFCRFAGAAADCLLVSGFSQLFDVADSDHHGGIDRHPALVVVVDYPAASEGRGRADLMDRAVAASK